MEGINGDRDSLVLQDCLLGPAQASPTKMKSAGEASVRIKQLAADRTWNRLAIYFDVAGEFVSA
eukprot:7063413-Alexandrium_andersonii.AAC.1